MDLDSLWRKGIDLIAKSRLEIDGVVLLDGQSALNLVAWRLLDSVVQKRTVSILQWEGLYTWSLNSTTLLFSEHPMRLGSLVHSSVLVDSKCLKVSKRGKAKGVVEQEPIDPLNDPCNLKNIFETSIPKSFKARDYGAIILRFVEITTTSASTSLSNNLNMISLSNSTIVQTSDHENQVILEANPTLDLFFGGLTSRINLS
jgi:hypothetical protein